MEGADGADGRGVQLPVRGGSLFRACRDAHNGYRLGGVELQTLDDAQGAAGLLDGETWQLAIEQNRRRSFSTDAGQAIVCAGRGARAPSRDAAGQPGGSTGGGDGGGDRGSQRTRVAGDDRREAGVRAGGNHRGHLDRESGRGGCVAGGLFPHCQGSRQAPGGRPFFHVFGARQTALVRQARDQVQRAVPLGGAGGARDRGWRRGGASRYHDTRLLARGRPGLSQRERHGRGTRHRQGNGAGAQGCDRSAPRECRHPGQLHKRILGWTQ